jgi:hypothetical protein
MYPALDTVNLFEISGMRSHLLTNTQFHDLEILKSANIKADLINFFFFGTMFII